MNVTVVLCTYNRYARLAVALDSVAASILPGDVEWEILVVDNNSSDRTRDIVEEFRRRHPDRFRYLFEPQQGLSRARNAGIREARGQIIAFMDDDVTVEPTWLQKLTAPLRDDRWAGAGGRIILQWPAAVPDWLFIDGPYARHGFPGFDRGPAAKELDGPPFGTNMAFRKSMFEKHGYFRTDMGRCADSLLSGEDTEFGRRVIAGGEHLRYEPSAVVYHPVPESSINRKRLLAWWFDKGRADVREFHIEPLYLFCSLIAWTARWLVAVQPAYRFYAKLVVWEKFGSLAELVGARQKRSEGPDVPSVHA